MFLLRFHKKTLASYGGYLDEAVYGANDGIITTFAVISGAAGASLGIDAVLIMGFANLIADGFSMGASSYLAIRTEEDVQQLKGFFFKNKDAFRRSAITFGAFLVAGIMPLVPFLVMPVDGGKEFVISAISSGGAFFIVGGSRTLVTHKGFFLSGFEMFLVGGVAATLAYSIGYLVQLIVA